MHYTYTMEYYSANKSIFFKEDYITYFQKKDWNVESNEKVVG